MTIGELEKEAGIADRAAFWAPFAKIVGTVEHNGKLISIGFESGVQHLRWMIQQRKKEQKTNT